MFTLDITLHGPLQYQTPFTNLSLNALVKNIRYVSFRSFTHTSAYNGITLHNFPLSDGPLSFKTGVNQLIDIHRIPASKLILDVQLFYFVHIINTNTSSSEAHILGEPSTLLYNRKDLPGFSTWAYSKVTECDLKIMVCSNN
jgi:hypothetical protein